MEIRDPNKWTSSSKMEDYIQNEFLGGKIFKSRKSVMASDLRPTVENDPLAAICHEPTELEKSLEA